MPAPKPDEFGRYRVLQDTGTEFSVSRPPLPSEKAVDEPASDIGGDELPPTYPAPKSLSSSTPDGQQADTQKESRNG